MSYTKALSYSGLKLYQECPARWHDAYILLNRQPPGKAAERGTRLHAQLEDYFNGGEYPAAAEVVAWRVVMEELNTPLASAEIKVAVDADWQVVDFDSDDAFVRGVIDLLTIDEGRPIIIDWKTGKKYEAHEGQGLFYAALISAQYPNRAVEARMFYIDHPLEVHHWVHSAFSIAAERGRISAVADSVRCATEYPTTPSGKACKWCQLSWRKGGKCEAAP